MYVNENAHGLTLLNTTRILYAMKTEAKSMPKPLRGMLFAAVILAAFMLMIYLSVNQDDYDKRTLYPSDYEDMTSGLMFFEEGTYVFSFGYAYETPAAVRIVRANTADAVNQLPLVLAEAELDKSGETLITLTLNETVYDLQIRYTDTVELGFTNIEGAGPIWNDTAFTLLMIACTAAALLFAYWREEKRAQPKLADSPIPEYTILLLLTVAALYATLPIMREYFTAGLDLPFHLMRIEGVKDGLLDGQFPVRIAPTYNGGTGYASSTLYPELLLYIPALFRLCGVSLITSYQGFVFLMNLATLLVAYYAMKKLTGKAALALIISLAYGLGVYRMTGVYNRVFLGETLAMIFFPCVLLGMVETLHRGKLSKWLIIGMTGVIQTHVVSVEIVLLFCTLYILAVLILRKTTGRAILRLCAAAGITVLINIWFLVPFLRFVQEDFNMFSYFKKTMLHAVYPEQLFASFLQPFGISLPLGETAGEMPMSVGLLPGLGILLFLLTYWTKKEEPLRRLNRASLLLGLISLAAASTLCPWTYITKIPVLGDMLYAIQFPSRFLSVGSLFLAIVFGVSVYALSGEKHMRLLIAACIVLTVFTVAPMLDQFIQSDKQTVVMKGKMDNSFANADVLRDYYYTDSDFEALAEQPMQINAPEGVAISNFSKHYLQVGFHYATGEAQTVTLPLYNYPGYTAVLGNGQALSISDGENHMLALTLPAGEGMVSVRYTGFWYYNVANFVSLGSLLLLFAWCIYKRRPQLSKRAG
jgi:hypothetical protein